MPQQRHRIHIRINRQIQIHNASPPTSRHQNQAQGLQSLRPTRPQSIPVPNPPCPRQLTKCFPVPIVDPCSLPISFEDRAHAHPKASPHRLRPPSHRFHFLRPRTLPLRHPQPLPRRLHQYQDRQTRPLHHPHRFLRRCLELRRRLAI